MQNRPKRQLYERGLNHAVITFPLSLFKTEFLLFLHVRFSLSICNSPPKQVTVEALLLRVWSYEHQHRTIIFTTNKFLPLDCPQRVFVLEGEDEHHHEKKSVLKKVKAKAKKIKETLKKHGHGHDHDHSHEEEEHEDEVEEKMAEDPEVQGAPFYESAAARIAVARQLPGGVNLDKPTVVAEDQYDSKYIVPSSTTFSRRQDQHSGKPGANMRMSAAVEVDHGRHVTFSSGSFGTKGSESSGDFVHGGGGTMGQSKMNTGTGTAMDVDPYAEGGRPELSNHQIKVADPTGAGGEEAGITPILQSFNKMNVYDEPESKPKSEESPNLYTGSHDQFCPEPLPEKATINPEDAPRATIAGGSSGYAAKISSATSAIADKAVAAKNVVALKLGYRGNGGSGEETSDSKNSGSVAEYGHKIAATLTEKLAPVYEVVAGVGSSVMSKVKGTAGTPGQEEEKRGGGKGRDGGVSVTEYLAEKLRPSEEDKALSEVISDALHKRKQEVEKKAEAEVAGKVVVTEDVAAKRRGSPRRAAAGS
ncbi:hypothetical protein U1Q18_041801 [Sarracenia purpurea var. burkii]